MWETWVQSLDWEDPLEKETATHSRPYKRWGLFQEFPERETRGLERTITFTLNYFGTVGFFLFAYFSYIKKNNKVQVRSDKHCTGINFSEKLALMPQGRMNHFSV